MTAATDPRLVRLSYGAYRALLGAYPPAFRRQYRADMAYVFRDMCRGAYRQHGVRALLPLWGGALLDLTSNVPKEALVALWQTRHQSTSEKPARICSSCNNEVAPDWQRCVYCGELLIAAATHDAPASGPWQGSPGRSVVSTAVLLPWKQKR
jgi:hypothetical protein